MVGSTERTAKCQFDALNTQRGGRRGKGGGSVFVSEGVQVYMQMLEGVQGGVVLLWLKYGGEKTEIKEILDLFKSFRKRRLFRKK